MHESLRQKLSVEQLQTLAQSLPKVSPEDDRMLTPFRGTFCQRFPEMKAVVFGYATEQEVLYVRTAKERFGIDLEAFYRLHPELCDSICAAIDAKASYELLTSSYAELESEESAGNAPSGSAQSILEAIGHPRGMDAIGLHYWDQLNPLLADAYAIFDAESLNAPFLGR
jgi:hypothetical protein